MKIMRRLHVKSIPPDYVIFNLNTTTHIVQRLKKMIYNLL